MTNQLCPKCKSGLTKVIFTGKHENDYCYWCYTCEDRIAKEAILIKE